MHSVFGHAIAWRRISEPRAPGPMMPIRMRSFAPRTLEAANEPARPEATLPMKLRRDCIDILLRLRQCGLKQLYPKGWLERWKTATPAPLEDRNGDHNK